jgi:periplasmic divalent cation tolerance protein
MTALIVFSTFPDESAARVSAGKLVEERLAACVNILPGLTSLYRWEGKLQTSDEVLLVIKTTRESYPRLESALKACHPYELPEILAVAVDAGLPEYLQWVAHETAHTNNNSNERLP